jgi:hypothetical protein
MIRSVARIVLSCAIALCLSGGCAQAPVRDAATPTHAVPPTASPAAPRMHAADSREMRFLAALERADTVEIVSLASREAELSRRSRADEDESAVHEDEWAARTEAEIAADWCTPADRCIQGNRILGRAAVHDAAGRRALVESMRQWLAFEPGYDVACVPEFRHTVEFETAGVRRRILLCFQCGEYQLREGAQLDEGAEGFQFASTAGHAAGREWFAQRFAAAGIPVETPAQ